MQQHPQLKGWVVSDAGGGIGVGRAIQALGKQDSVQVVALDDLPELMNRSKVVLWIPGLPAGPCFWNIRR